MSAAGGREKRRVVAGSRAAARLIGAWHTEHVQIARLLDLLEREVALFHASERPNYDLMRDVVHFLRHFTDRVHHLREDAAFVRLVARDPAVEPQVNRLLQEHRVIARAGEALFSLLEAVLDGTYVARADIEAAAATYLVYYRNHIATEETAIMSRAASVLTAADWEQVAAAVPQAELRDAARAARALGA